MRTGSIYKIECLVTKKVYIGQTVQNPPIKRWLDHYGEINNSSNESYLYRDIRRFGIENFTFQILEIDISLEDLNKKEVEYREKYKSNNSKYGYNLTKGGNFTVKSVIGKENVRAIINSIKYDKEKTFVEIARIFNVSRDIVSDINNGATWYFCDEEYPIRDNSANKNKLTENEVYDIYAKLKNKMSLTDIAKEYNVSITNISNINQGIIYRFLEDDSYPIYVPINSKPRVSIEKIKKVVELLKHNPDYTYSKIGNIVGIGRKTVSGINNGKLYTDLVEELGINEFPIR